MTERINISFPLDQAEFIRLQQDADCGYSTVDGCALYTWISGMANKVYYSVLSGDMAAVAKTLSFVNAAAANAESFSNELACLYWINEGIVSAIDRREKAELQGNDTKEEKQ